MVVKPQMCLHVAQPDYLVAKMALSCARAIRELVRRETAKQDLGVGERWVLGSFLRHDQVTKLAKYFLAWTNGSSVVCEVRNVRSQEIAIGAIDGGSGVKNGVMFDFRRRHIAVEIIVRAMPMVLPYFGVFEENV